MLGDPTSSHLSSNKGHHFCKKKKNEPKPPFGKLSGWWLNQPVLKEYARQHASLPPIFGEKKKTNHQADMHFFPQQKKYIHLIPLHEHQVWLNMYTITQLIFL